MMKCYRNMVVGCYVILFFLVIYIFGMGMKLIFKFVNKVGGICFRKYLLFLQFLVFRSWQYLKLYLQFVIVWSNFQKIFNFNRKFLYFWCQCWLYQVCYDRYIYKILGLELFQKIMLLVIYCFREGLEIVYIRW